MLVTRAVLVSKKLFANLLSLIRQLSVDEMVSDFAVQQVALKKAV